jgi:hypothetical protein
MSEDGVNNYPFFASKRAVSRGQWKRMRWSLHSTPSAAGGPVEATTFGDVDDADPIHWMRCFRGILQGEALDAAASSRPHCCFPVGENNLLNWLRTSAEPVCHSDGCGFVYNAVRHLTAGAATHPSGNLVWNIQKAERSDATVLEGRFYFNHHPRTPGEVDGDGRSESARLVSCCKLVVFPLDRCGLLSAALLRLAFVHGLLFELRPPPDRSHQPCVDVDGYGRYIRYHATYSDAVGAKHHPSGATDRSTVSAPGVSSLPPGHVAMTRAFPNLNPVGHWRLGAFSFPVEPQEQIELLLVQFAELLRAGFLAEYVSAWHTHLLPLSLCLTTSFEDLCGGPPPQVPPPIPSMDDRVLALLQGFDFDLVLGTLARLAGTTAHDLMARVETVASEKLRAQSLPAIGEPLLGYQIRHCSRSCGRLRAPGSDLARLAAARFLHHACHTNATSIHGSVYESRPIEHVFAKYKTAPDGSTESWCHNEELHEVLRPHMLVGVQINVVPRGSQNHPVRGMIGATCSASPSETRRTDVYVMWHGTSQDTADLIVQHGFDTHYLSRSLYGRGIYFAANPQTAIYFAAQSARAQQRGVDTMVLLLCLVRYDNVHTVVHQSQYGGGAFFILGSPHGAYVLAQQLVQVDPVQVDKDASKLWTVHDASEVAASRLAGSGQAGPLTGQPLAEQSAAAPPAARPAPPVSVAQPAASSSTLSAQPKKPRPPKVQSVPAVAPPTLTDLHVDPLTALTSLRDLVTKYIDGLQSRRRVRATFPCLPTDRSHLPGKTPPSVAYCGGAISAPMCGPVCPAYADIVPIVVEASNQLAGASLPVVYTPCNPLFASCGLPLLPTAFPPRSHHLPIAFPPPSHCICTNPPPWPTTFPLPSHRLPTAFPPPSHHLPIASAPTHRLPTAFPPPFHCRSTFPPPKPPPPHRLPTTGCSL